MGILVAALELRGTVYTEGHTYNFVSFVGATDSDDEAGKRAQDGSTPAQGFSSPNAIAGTNRGDVPVSLTGPRAHWQGQAAHERSSLSSRYSRITQFLPVALRRRSRLFGQGGVRLARELRRPKDRDEEVGVIGERSQVPGG